MSIENLRRALSDYQRYADGGLSDVASAQQMAQNLDGERVSTESLQLVADRARLSEELALLRKTVAEKADALRKAEEVSGEFRSKATELERELSTLRQKASFSHLLDRVSEQAQRHLLDSPELRQRFEEDTAIPAFVVSIDLRRSTELMLKAREPRLFAEFLIDLSAKLQRIICGRFGVFDKFTGDGVLAFFPEFFSGPDAGYLALDAAVNCHSAFASHYASHRHCFSSVLKDTGLGIGVDYGNAHIVFVGGQLTVVGQPVVYACRMGGAPAGTTMLNQPAFEKLFEAYSAFCDFVEAEIEVKHEGPIIAYRVSMNGKRCPVRDPEWLQASNTKNTSNRQSART